VWVERGGLLFHNRGGRFGFGDGLWVNGRVYRRVELWINGGVDECDGIDRFLMPDCFGDELSSARCAEFAVEVFDMIVDGVGRAPDGFGDGADRVSDDELVEDDLFSLGEPGDGPGFLATDCALCFVSEYRQGDCQRCWFDWACAGVGEVGDDDQGEGGVGVCVDDARNLCIGGERSVLGKGVRGGVPGLA